MQINIFYNTVMPKYYRATAKYRAVCLKALGKIARGAGELNLIFVSEAEILKINKKFLRHNYITDVITFHYPHGTPFGDIFICFKQGLKQAKEQGHGGLKELLIIAAHGALHLAGHDDKTPKERAAMNAIAAQVATGCLTQRRPHHGRYK